MGGMQCLYSEEKSEKEVVKEMVLRIHEEFCKGCGLCIEFCPKKVYELSNRLNSKGYQLPDIVRPEDCSECGLCEFYCPEFAIVYEPTEDSEPRKRAAQ